MHPSLKLNLGCGPTQKLGYINVDKYGNPDVLHDLEQFPWPWKDNSVKEILLNHVLEHLGETTAVYLTIMKELYRICEPDALIQINTPHPRHDDFLNDPTHVRIVTPESLALFSKSLNNEWIHNGYANSPLGLYLDVNFEVVRTTYVLDSGWERKLAAKEVTEAEIGQAMRKYNNVVKELRIDLKVVK